MGYHLSDWFNLTFVRERASDFNEMSLHHLATFTCYFAAIWGNYLVIGGVVAYLHDIADIFTTTARVLNSTHYEKSALVCFIFLLASWVWTRLYVLPQFLYRLLTDRFPESMLYFQRFNAVLLGILQLLHIYWFILLAQMAIHKAKTGKAEDLQNQKVKKQ